MGQLDEGDGLGEIRCHLFKLVEVRSSKYYSSLACGYLKPLAAA
jgi:hypothetical protein